MDTMQLCITICYQVLKVVKSKINLFRYCYLEATLMPPVGSRFYPTQVIDPLSAGFTEIVSSFLRSFKASFCSLERLG